MLDAELLSLTSVLNTTSDEPARTTGDTIQPHSLFDLLKHLQTPTSAFLTLSFFISLSLSLFFFRTDPQHIRDAGYHFHSFSFSVVMALGAATVRQAGDELVVAEGAQVV